MLPVALNQTVAWNSFQAGQPYLWQIVALLWGWWACREALLGAGRRRFLGLVGWWLAGCLAAWINTVSLAALLAIVTVEVVHAPASRPALPGVAVVLGATALVEAWLRRLYNAFCKQTFGQQFVTALRVDRGHLLENVEAVAAASRREGLLVPLALGLAAASVPGLSRTERANQITFLLLACFSLPAIAAIQHFRGNGFSSRYFSFAAFWAVAAAVHGVLVVVRRVTAAPDPRVGLAALVTVVAAVPTGPSDFLAPARRDAAVLVSPRSRVLLGSYAEVYVPASLAPRGSLLPLPKQGEFDRFLLRSLLQPGREVLAPCELDSSEGVLLQYGVMMRRVVEDSSSKLGRWCLHRVERGVPMPPTGR